VSNDVECIDKVLTNSLSYTKQITDAKDNPMSSSEENNSDDDRLEADEQETDEIANNNYSLFDCKEEGCTKVFLKLGQYMNHLASEKHRRLEEKNNLTDTAMLTYHTKLKRNENVARRLGLTEASSDGEVHGQTKRIFNKEI